jgi:tRNA A37 threonylcarbamoyladenosine dehydratase
MDILLQQPALEGNGRSIIIDLKDSIKTKINLIKDIQKESTTATTYYISC